MAKAQFQGYARGGKFQRRDPGYDALQSMKTHSDRVIRGMEGNLRSLEKRNSDAERALLDVHRREAQNRSDNFRIEKDSFQNREAGLNQNIATTKANMRAANVRHEGKLKEIEALGRFSKTLTTTLFQLRKEDLDKTVDQAYNERIANGVPFNVKERQALQEQIVRNYGRQINGTADMAEARGALPKSVEYIRNKDQAWALGEAKGTAKLAGEGFEDYAEKELNRLGISDPETAAVVLQTIQNDYLRAHNLYGINADFLTDTLEGMAKSRNVILGTLNDLQIDGFGAKRVNQAEKALIADFNAENVDALFRAKWMHRKGNQVIGPSASVTYILNDVFGNPEITPDVTAAWNTPILNPDGSFNMINVDGVKRPQTWGDRYGQRWEVDVLQKRAARDEAIRDRVQNEENGRQKSMETEVETWIQTDWNRDIEVLNERRKDLELKGYNTEFLNRWEALSIQNQSEDYLRGEFEEAERYGTLDTADFNHPYVTQKLREDFFETAQAQTKAREEAFMTDDDVKGSFETKLKNQITTDAVISPKTHQSYRPATAAAMKMYRRLRTKYAKTMDAATASQNAWTEVNKRIEEGTGVFTIVEGVENDKIKGWTVKEGADAQEQKAHENRKSKLENAKFYGAFVSGPHDSAFNFEANNHTTVISIKGDVITNPMIIDTKPLVPLDLLDSQARNLNEGRPIDIPEIYRELSKEMPGLGTAWEIMQRQWKAAGIEVNLKEDWRTPWLQNSTDSSGEKLLKNINSIEGLAQANEILFNNGSENPKYMTRRVQKAIIPKRPEEINTEINPIIQSLGTESDGLVTPENFIYSEDKKGVASISISKYNEGVEWMIDNGDDYGWYYNIETGTFMKGDY